MASLSLLLIAALASASAEAPARRLAPVAASGTATVRILTPALVGAELGPPRAGMTARPLTVRDLPGREATVWVYDFE